MKNDDRLLIARLLKNFLVSLQNDPGLPQKLRDVADMLHNAPEDLIMDLPDGALCGLELIQSHADNSEVAKEWLRKEKDLFEVMPYQPVYKSVL